MRKDISLQGILGTQLRELVDDSFGRNFALGSSLRFTMPANTSFGFDRNTIFLTSINKGVGNITNGTKELRQSQSNFWGNHGIRNNPTKNISFDRLLYIRSDVHSLSTTRDPYQEGFDNLQTGVFFENRGSTTVDGTSYRKVSHMDGTSMVTDRLLYKTPITYGRTGTSLFKLSSVNEVNVELGPASIKKPTAPFRFTLNHGSANRILSLDAQGQAVYFCGGIPTTTSGYSDYFIRQAVPLFYFARRNNRITIDDSDNDDVDLDFPILLNNTGTNIATYNITLVSGASAIHVLTRGFSRVNERWVLDRIVYSTSISSSSPKINATYIPSSARITRGNTFSFKSLDANASGAYLMITVPMTETATSSVIEISREDE